MTIGELRTILESMNDWDTVVIEAPDCTIWTIDKPEIKDNTIILPVDELT
jgi:hypothetical protein